MPRVLQKQHPKNRKQTQNIVFSFKNVSLEKKQANLLNKDGPP